MIEWVLATALPWFITVCLLIVVVLSIGKFPAIVKSARIIPPWIMGILFVCTLIGAYIRFQWVPEDHRIFFDEDRYLSYAISFAKFNTAVSLDFATDKQSIVGVPDQAIRSSVPVYHAWIMHLFGFSETVLFRAAKTASTLQIPLMFIAAYLLFDSVIIAFWSAAIIAFLPLSVYWSTSTMLDNYFVLFSLFTMISACLYGKKSTLTSGIYFIVNLCILLCVRFESFLFLPVLLGILFILRKQRKIKLSRTDLFIAGAALLFIAVRALLSASVLSKPWCCAESIPLETFSVQYFMRNLLPNIYSLFIQTREFPVILTLLALWAMVKGKNPKVTVLTVWFILFFCIYSFYYAGMFYTMEFSGSYGRYFLILIPPLIILSGVSVQYIHTLLSHASKQTKIWIFAATLITLASLYPTLIHYRQTIKTSPYDKIVDMGPRITHIFLTDYMLPRLPKNATIIYPLTGYPLMTGHPVVYLDTFDKNESVRRTIVQMIKDGRPVYILQTHECEIFPHNCDAYASVFTFTQHIIAQIENVHFQIDRVTLKSATESATITTTKNSLPAL